MANTPSVAALGQRSACAVRATRLGANCAPLGGDNNAVIAAALATATFTPDLEEGQKFEPKDACGNTSWVDAEPSVVKRYTVAMEFNTHDYALVELLTDARLVIGATGTTYAGKIIGIERPGVTTAHKYGAAIEIFSKNVLSDGACGTAAEVPPYTRHILPRVYLNTEDITFANDVITMKLAGWGGANPAWNDPWGEWDGLVPMGADTPFASVYSETIPTVGTGFVTSPASGS